MKTLLFLLLALPLAAEPIWLDAGKPAPTNLIRLKLNSPTQSMAPAMTGKEVIYIEPYTGQPIYVNDFVGFVRSDGKRVLHRVTALNSRAIYTSGDANSFSDGWTPKKKIYMVVRYVVRG